MFASLAPLRSLLPRRRSLLGLGLLSLVLVLLLGLRSPARADVPRHYTDLTFPPAPEVRLPDSDRFQLANGMTVYLVEDRELPLVSGRAIVRTGARWEPADRVGLAGIVGTVLRTGGTQQHDADTLNRLLEDRAAWVESSIGDSSGSVRFGALSEDFDDAFGWFAEVLRSPAFAPDQIELAKTQIRGNIARRNDEPEDIAGREFYKLVYGDDSPYARTVEYATLDAIDREDVLAFYRRYFAPQNVILGISGDFDRRAMRQRVEAVFGDWQADAPPAPPLPEVTQAKTGGLYFVDRPQLTQSSVLLGHLGGRLDSPDYPALSVLNGVLNGFGGRLFNELRSRQGLAYSVYGYWGANFDMPGTFLAGGQTRSEATVPFVQGIQAEIDRLRNEPVEPEELAYAKDSTLNSFIFNFVEPGQTLSRLMTYDYYDYPADFLTRYQQGVKAATAADLQRVAQTYLQPDRLVTLVVGSSDRIEPPLTALDPDVTAIDATIPGEETARQP